MKPFFVLSLLAFAACTPAGDPAPLEDWTPGIPTTGDTGSTDTGSVDTNPLGGLLGVQINLPYDTRFGTTADAAVSPQHKTGAQDDATLRRQNACVKGFFPSSSHERCEASLPSTNWTVSFE